MKGKLKVGNMMKFCWLLTNRKRNQRFVWVWLQIFDNFSNRIDRIHGEFARPNIPTAFVFHRFDSPRTQNGQKLLGWIGRGRTENGFEKPNLLIPM